MKREPKSIHSTEIIIMGRPGHKKGTISLGPGSFSYTRSGARHPQLELTYQQLQDILEREIQYRAIQESQLKLPKPAKDGDFVLNVTVTDNHSEVVEHVFSSSLYWNKLDPRRIDQGDYQFSPDMAKGRLKKQYQWFAHVSIQGALWIIQQYIEKFLANKKFTDATDSNVVISKKSMYKILIALGQRVSP